MQSLNEDMDELFRRAAEDYPLNTGNGDWNKVLQDLDATEGNLREDKKNYRFLWLLLLLPIGFMIGRYIGNENKVISTNHGKEATITSVGAGNTRPNTQPLEFEGTKAAGKKQKN